MQEISVDALRLQAIQLAAQTNPSSTSELLSNADKIYGWITKDGQKPAWKEGFDNRKTNQNENSTPDAKKEMV